MSNTFEILRTKNVFVPCYSIHPSVHPSTHPLFIHAHIYFIVDSSHVDQMFFGSDPVQGGR